MQCIITEKQANQLTYHDETKERTLNLYSQTVRAKEKNRMEQKLAHSETYIRHCPTNESVMSVSASTVVQEKSYFLTPATITCPNSVFSLTLTVRVH